MAGLTGGGLAFAVFCATWTLLTAFLATLVAFVYIRSRKTIDCKFPNSSLGLAHRIGCYCRWSGNVLTPFE